MFPFLYLYLTYSTAVISFAIKETCKVTTRVKGHEGLHGDLGWENYIAYLAFLAGDLNVVESSGPELPYLTLHLVAPSYLPLVISHISYLISSFPCQRTRLTRMKRLLRRFQGFWAKWTSSHLAQAYHLPLSPSLSCAVPLKVINHSQPPVILQVEFSAWQGFLFFTYFLQSNSLRLLSYNPWPALQHPFKL